MREIGIDISRHASKRVSDISLDAVDTIVTLCVEEVCPFVPGAVRRLHWGLADPAAVDGSLDDRLAAFRQTRDKLRCRIRVFLAGEQVVPRSLPESVPGVDRLPNGDILK